MSKPEPEEIFLKNKLEEQLGVSIRHNENDPPDLEFELNGKLIGIEVTQIMENMSDGNSRRWLEIQLAETVHLCLDAFENKYVHAIREKGETRNAGYRMTWENFMKSKEASKEKFNAIRDSIQKTITQGLKVIFKLPEVKKEKFFSDPLDKLSIGNLRILNDFWDNGTSGAPIDGGFVEKRSDCIYTIKTEGFCLDIFLDETLFHRPLLGTDKGGVSVNDELELLKDCIQKAIKIKKKTCMSLNKSGPRKGQRKDDKYDEMWLYLYDGINPSLFFGFKGGHVKAMPFNFENYWSKVCLFTSLCVPKWYISLSGDQR